MISARDLRTLVDSTSDRREVRRLFEAYHVAVTEARAQGQTVDFDRWLRENAR